MSAVPATAPVEPAPHMDAEGLACFVEAVGRSACYLEYGCGGSTVYAATVAGVPQILSIESDPVWLTRVRESLGSGPSKIVLQHCNIGPVGDWGTPVDRAHAGDFWRYMALPWMLARERHWVPDTVLIDGRFRVACFLYSLVSARVGTRILFDDYFGRPQYFAVEEFCALEARHGSMCVFAVAKQFSIPEICAAIAQYSIVWD